MDLKRLKEIIKKGEGSEIEFKESLFKLNKNTFESICGFLNRRGGHLILGVTDEGSIEGVVESEAHKMVNSIITNANNPQKLDPPFYLSPEVIELEGKQIIYTYVPESSQVHKTAGKIFDRNDDGDLDITSQTDQVTQLYLRKQTTYSENNIFPYLKLSDFKEELFQKVRKLAKNERPDHPWLTLDNEQFLRSAGLYRKDFQTGKHGYTLAAVLLFGNDETIQNILPAFKTDAILRVQNTDKYDDRDVIATNLIDSFERLMYFVQKNLPDAFHQEEDQRISLRSRIFYEVVSNILIHREYTNAYPAKFIIEPGRVITENWNRPHGNGKIDPDYFSPFPKNPVIAKFFHQIGRAEELGSGIRNMYKYVSHYTPGRSPEFIEEDVFKAIIPVPVKKSESSSPSTIMPKGQKGLGERLGERLGENEIYIIDMIGEDAHVTIEELSQEIGISTTAIENNIKKLKKKGIIERIGPARGGKWKVHKEVDN